jgi:hypothetical protein
VLLLEIAAQGIKGVAPAGGRLALRPGYNVLAVDGPPLRKLLEALLQPGSRDAEGLPRAAPGPAGQPVRAGVTFVGNDQVTYRLVRDFGGACQLHRFDAERRAFAPVSQDLEEIGALLQGAAGIPGRARFGALLAISAADLPSRASPAGLNPGGLAAAAAARRPSTPEQARKRLAELGQELEKARRAEGLQYRLDGLQSRLFKVEEALREGARVREGLDAAEAAAAEQARVAELAERMGDFPARLLAYQKATARRDEALARLTGERDRIEEVEARGAPSPFWQAPVFLAAAGAGTLLLAGGALGAVQGSGLRYLALLDIPVFGVAGLAALRWVDALAERARLGRRRKMVEERERKATESWERDSAEVRAALKELGVAGVPELQEAFSRLAGVQAARAEWREKLAAWEQAPETRGAVEEKARVERELREVEGGLSAEAGGYLREPRSIEAEMARLEAEAAAPAEEAPAATVVAPAVEPLRALLERAGTELKQSPASVALGLQQKASQALVALSGQRLAGLSVDDRGNLQARQGERPTPVLSLSPADRDLCWLALRLALLEQALHGGKAVAFVDDALAGLPESVRRLAARLLKQLARPGQLLHATRDPLFREAADHAA